MCSRVTIGSRCEDILRPGQTRIMLGWTLIRFLHRSSMTHHALQKMRKRYCFTSEITHCELFMTRRKNTGIYTRATRCLDNHKQGKPAAQTCLLAPRYHARIRHAQPHPEGRRNCGVYSHPIATYCQARDSPQCRRRKFDLDSSLYPRQFMLYLIQSIIYVVPQKSLTPPPSRQGQ